MLLPSIWLIKNSMELNYQHRKQPEHKNLEIIFKTRFHWYSHHLTYYTLTPAKNKAILSRRPRRYASVFSGK